MDKRVLYATLFVVSCMALFTSSQQAPILIPEWYEGIAHLDGEIAPQSTKIEVKTLNGEVVGSGLVANDRGQYADVPFDDIKANFLEVYPGVYGEYAEEAPEGDFEAEAAAEN